MTQRVIHIVFAGGGTGGHLFPAIAIAERIRELLADRDGTEIIFVGTRRGLEYRMRDLLGFPLRLINVRGLVRSFTLKNLLVPFVLVCALLKARSLLNEFKPDIVVGTGGYVSWPVLKMAVWKEIPTVLQEQNSFPGITTRQLASRARRIYLGFTGAKEYLHTNAEILVTGNPVRGTIFDGDRNAACAEYNLDPSKKTILVLGGSQGARTINQAVLKSLKNNSLPAGYQVLWQTGRRDHKDVAARAGSKASSCTLFPFAHNMRNVYAASDLVVTRAGALTLAELTACELPSILIPYPYAAGDHQRKNARDIVNRGMADMIDEGELNSIDLLVKTVTLMESEQFLKMKSQLAKESKKSRSAVDVIARDIIELIMDIRREAVENNRGADKTANSG
ncbi:MAG: undecaprenyldiphospho-muramoylpentapeptide beta-N-acetylglucosaminyltransferase [Candidatus Zixiibacteriota bacterium]|nr:MAG: undecaprenyldiphospho-muramoylpentapeptide beta-N-acetylglucosaminyltransferase [candidate division Zixibacteria bacterium]